MSAQLKALTIQNGVTRRILDIDTLDVAAGITGPGHLAATAPPMYNLTLETANVVGATDSGGDVNVTASNGGSAAGNPGGVYLQSGSAGTANVLGFVNGGNVGIGSGDGGGGAAGGNGGVIAINAGASLVGPYHGGNIGIQAGNSAGQMGGVVSLGGGQGVSGGAIGLLGGNGSNGLGGYVSIQAGDSDGLFPGAHIDIKSGNSLTGTGSGGAVNLVAGKGGDTAGDGGLVDIGGGAAVSGQGGSAWLHGGNSTAGAGGGVSVFGGDGTGGLGGDVLLDVGNGTTVGNIYVGYDGNACPVYLGKLDLGSVVDIQDFASNAAADALFRVGAKEMLFNELQSHSIRVATPATGNGFGLSIASASSLDGAGGKISLVGGDTATGAVGGSATVKGGDNADVAGGNAVLTGGNGQTAGGRARVLGGNGNPGTTATGGVAEVTGGSSGDGATGNGGAVTINGGQAASTNGNGGSITVTAANATGTGLAGTVNILAGVGGSSSAGGTVSIDGGAGQTGQIGGPVLITGGTTAGTVGGLVRIQGNSSGVTGGAVSLLGGNGSTNGGTALVQAGSASGENVGGTTNIFGGNNAGNTGGPVYVQGGVGTNINFHGAVNIGVAHTSVTNISTTATGSATTNIGNGLTAGSPNTVIIHAGIAANNGRFEIDSSIVHFKTGGDYTIQVDPGNGAGALNIASADALSGNTNGNDLYLYAGNESGTGIGGNLFLDSGGSVTTGDISIGVAGAQNLTLNAATRMFFTYGGTNVAIIRDNVDADSGTYPNALRIQSGAVLRADAGGMIDLPTSFTINKIATNYATPGTGQVTAANLNTLTAGSASDASALHYHASTPGGLSEYLATTTEAVLVGTPVVALTGLSGINTVQNAIANGGAARQGCVGLAVVAGAPAVAQNIAVAGVLPVPYTSFDAASTGLIVAGAAVYVSETTQKLTVVAPNGAGTSSQKVGMILSVTGTVANLLLQIGDLTLLPA
jgi:hypothetical protein